MVRFLNSTGKASGEIIYLNNNTNKQVSSTPAQSSSSSSLIQANSANANITLCSDSDIQSVLEEEAKKAEEEAEKTEEAKKAEEEAEKSEEAEENEDEEKSLLMDKLWTAFKENTLTAREFAQQGFWEFFDITEDDIKNASIEELAEFCKTACNACLGMEYSHHQVGNTILAAVLTTIDEDELEDFINEFNKITEHSSFYNIEDIAYGILDGNKDMESELSRLISSHKDLFPNQKYDGGNWLHYI